MIVTKTKELHGTTFSVSADDRLAGPMEAMFSIIAGIDPSGLRDKYIISVPWNRFYLFAKDGGYEVMAPDYATNPYEHVTSDLTFSLWVQAEHSTFLQQHNLEGQEVRHSDSVILVKGALQSMRISMQRSADVSKGDSGWTIKPIPTPDPEEYESIDAYQLIKLRPSIIKALVLPADYLAVFNGDELEAILDNLDNRVF